MSLGPQFVGWKSGLTWNEILDIRLRNPGNADIERLLQFHNSQNDVFAYKNGLTEGPL